MTFHSLSSAMQMLSVTEVSTLAISTFLGGAVLILFLALHSYARLPTFRSYQREVFYAGKHVLITGGSSGIGKELARILVAAGANVSLIARNEERLEAAAVELASSVKDQANTKRINIAIADCSDPARVDAVVYEVENVLGPIDVLVNSAGKAMGGYFESMEANELKGQVESNFLTQLYPTHAVFKRMCRRRRGHIVFVSSMAGLTGVFGQTAYSASKFAVRGLAESLYYEGKPFDIGVTVVFPPDTDTPGLAAERATMPPETIQISETGGLFSAEVVAQSIADGVVRGRYRVTVGLIGKMLGTLTSGYSPNVSLWEVVFMPLLRAITPAFIGDSNRIVRRGHSLRFSGIDAGNWAKQ